VTKTTTKVCAWLGLAFAAALAAAGAAEVKVSIGPSGRKIIFNEGLEQRARRLAGSLVPVPDIDLESLIARHCGVRNLDPRLVKAVIQVESGYNRRAISNKGAMGLMQLTRDTASELAVADPYDPDQNLRGGTSYLRQMIDRFQGRLELAVAAYNAGPAAVERHGGIPPFPETRDYVQRVLDLYRGVAMPLPPTPLQFTGGHRRKPYLFRDARNRLVLTTAVGGTQ
jgi:soluble lytic murein transglycosylase-like protein